MTNTFMPNDHIVVFFTPVPTAITDSDQFQQQQKPMESWPATAENDASAPQAASADFPNVAPFLLWPPPNQQLGQEISPQELVSSQSTIFAALE